MKKNMKKLFVLLTLCFIGINVNAKNLEIGDPFTVKKSGTATVNGLSSYGDSKPHSEAIYSSVDTTSENFVSYCEDPNWRQGNSYKVERILASGNIIKEVKAYDLGLLEIMKNGKNQYNNSYKTEGGITVSGSDLYTATSIATRAFTMGVYGFGKDIGSDVNGKAAKIRKASSYITKAIEWATLNIKEINAVSPTNCTGTGDAFAKCYAEKFIKQKKGASWYDNRYNFNVTSPNSVGSNVLAAAYSLFKKGLDKAYEVMIGDVSIATIGETIAGSATNKKTNGEMIEEYYHQTIEFARFDAEKGKISNFVLTCQDCAKNNITLGSLEIYNPQTKEYQPLENINVLTLFEAEGKTKSGKIELQFKVTRKKDDENCKSVNYTITYNYNDPTLEYIGAKLASTKTNEQRFFVLQKNNGDLKDEMKGTIKCSVTCDTEISVPECSYNEEDATVKIDGPKKVKTCIIDNFDDADNSYKLSEDNNGVDSSNPYCQVYCKEDYAEIKLNPIVQNVKCGGYFKLTSKINGTKTCYTGGDTEDSRIDKEQYLKDITDAQKSMIEGRDLIIKATEARKKIDSAKETCCDKNTYTYWFSTGEYIGLNPKEPTDEGYVGIEKVKKHFTFGNSGSCNDETDGVCTGSNPSGYTESQGELERLINAAEASGKKLISDGFKAYKEAISNYNACTTGWINEFAFAQKLKYYYDERRDTSDNVYTPYLDLITGNHKEELTYLEKYGLEQYISTIKICKGTTNDQYECLSSAVPDKDGSIEEGRMGKYNYKSSYGSDVFEDRPYTICDNEKCETDNPQVSQATFVKKEVTKEQKYITPTAFYQVTPSGSIVIYDDYSLDKINLEELKNKLPLSTSSVGGGNFKLIIENLGEFYTPSDALDSDNKNGRLIDFGKSNEKKSVAYVKGVGTSDAFSGEYVCNYENTCRPKDCPNCEFVCEGDNCTWKECPLCNITCVNCIFNLDELNIISKTITTTDVNAANRTRGYNWITSSSMEALRLLTKKASLTVSEIEEINEMVYDDKKTDGSTLGFSIKLTPEIINKITNYNKENQNNGGYINNSLTCYDATIDGETYKNIYCYSELIDKLVDENGSEVTVLPSRINDAGRRENDTGNSGYWTLWSNYKIDKTSESVIGGPSWK